MPQEPVADSSAMATAVDTTEATDVYVWGLNDKDQLGGIRGSKV